MQRYETSWMHLTTQSCQKEVTDNIPQGLHLITMSTPNGQKVQIMLEELKDIYGTEWTQTLMYGSLIPGRWQGEQD